MPTETVEGWWAKGPLVDGVAMGQLAGVRIENYLYIDGRAATSS
jgi:hypothetical protein